MSGGRASASTFFSPNEGVKREKRGAWASRFSCFLQIFVNRG